MNVIKEMKSRVADNLMLHNVVFFVENVDSVSLFYRGEEKKTIRDEQLIFESTCSHKNQKKMKHLVKISYHIVCSNGKFQRYVNVLHPFKCEIIIRTLNGVGMHIHKSVQPYQRRKKLEINIWKYRQ